ncbi:MAG: hypothetical protein A4E66_02300 [Syntrophus sp. PtaB.Bin001]|nr:MAG: hypothetical protein A4E66_02300 [Syntrophus sp. PtaB.Bin001]
MEQGRHPAAQGENRDMTRIRKGEGKIAVGPYVGIGIDYSLAIGPEDPDAVLFGHGHTLRLDGRPNRTDLGKPAAVEDRVLDAFCTAIIKGLGNMAGRNGHVNHVHVSGNI